jgi:hypothetical protein
VLSVANSRPLNTNEPTSPLQGFLHFLVSVGLTFLPPRYRRDKLLRWEAAFAGAVQFFAALLFLGYRFFTFWSRAAGNSGDPTQAVWNDPRLNDNFGGGLFMLAEFVMQPLHMLLIYLMYEAVVRFAAAAFVSQVLGSLPFYVVGAVHGLFDKAVHRHYVGARIVDEVIRDGERLVVCSSRPKLNWNPYMTIEFEGEFYQMVKEEPGQKPRRFVYHLRRNPVGRIVVTIDHYKIDAVMKAPPKEDSALKQTRDVMASQLKQKLKTPPVEDLLLRGGGVRQDYDLKIYSCRPKPDWNWYVVIEFEDAFYELFKQEEASAPREYVFYLRKAPPNKPASVVRKYRVDDVLKD